MNKKHVWALAAITVLTLTACGKGSSAKPEGGADKAAAGGASPARRALPPGRREGRGPRPQAS